MSDILPVPVSTGYVVCEVRVLISEYTVAVQEVEAAQSQNSGDEPR
jgi:hypothetical protein